MKADKNTVVKVVPGTELHRWLRIQAIQTGVTMHALILEALENHRAKVEAQKPASK